jgi:hypothetical protein
LESVTAYTPPRTVLPLINTIRRRPFREMLKDPLE